MGDTDAPGNEVLPEATESANTNVSKPSIDILKEVKPSENISIEPSNDPSLANIGSQLKPSEAAISEKNVKDKSKVEPEEHKPKEDLKDKGKNRSDIFSLNKVDNLPSTIFSVGGAPSKTIHNITSNANKNSSSDDTIGTQNSNTSKLSQLRNPLTGIGVNSNDEFKNKPSRRRDGNPLLGLGYKDEHPTPTGQRIPPGGYSKGLW